MKRIGVIILLVGTGLLFTPMDSSARRIVIRTTDMVSNESALEGMRGLVSLLGLAGVSITSLQEAAKQHQLHQEGPEAGGLVLANGATGAFFYPRRSPFKYPTTGFPRFFVIVDDDDTHAVLKEDTINDLVNRHFLHGSFYLRDTAKAAIHELLHAMIFRTGCFKAGAKKGEELVENLEGDISLAVTIYLLWQAGETSTALRLYEGLVSGVAEKLRRHRRWATCYEILGIPGPVPQLSPWPMFGHDPQLTGQSPYTGPQTDNLRWRFVAGSPFYIFSPVIASDGTIYSRGIADTGGHTLVALNPDGTIKWKFQPDSYLLIDRSSPALGPDGTVYQGFEKCCWSSFLYAINPDGTSKWWYRTAEPTAGFASRIATPIVAPDGAIYVVSGSAPETTGLFVIEVDGALKWTVELPMHFPAYPPAIAPDGAIYVASDVDLHVYALTLLGELKWRYWVGQPSQPAVGPDGTIYIAGRNEGLYAINPDGTLKWKVPLPSPHIVTKPAVGPNGTIVVGTAGWLVAFDSTGLQKWQQPISLSTEPSSSPIIGSDGTVYLGSSDGKVYAFGSDGVLKWSFATDGRILSSASIDSEGVLYIGSEDMTLYAFGP